ncbi:MAG: hypothetical protein IJ776_08590 [Paludibacteraceae bacterium]|nr:hypothetical protein [Paludibacteraceae bacterium]
MKTRSIFILTVAAFMLVGCDKHDFFDDLTITGEVGPQAYWEIGSSAVSAGQSLSFQLQYYTALKGVSIDRSEAWYNLTENIERQVSCPWVSSFTYSVISSVAEEKRIEQKIKTYAHTEDLWNDSLHAYYIEESFPVSSTLAPFSWTNPAVFEADKMNQYFGEGFMQHFKDSLEQKLKYADYRSMMIGLGLVDDFMQYTDSTFDVNSDAYVYHFKWNADSTAQPVPDELTTLYRDSVSFDRLIYSSADNSYSVSYIRKYNIRALIRVYDDRDVYGITEPKEIEVIQ